MGPGNRPDPIYKYKYKYICIIELNLTTLKLKIIFSYAFTGWFQGMKKHSTKVEDMKKQDPPEASWVKEAEFFVDGRFF